MRYILAIDPGKATGIALLSLDDSDPEAAPNLLETWEVPFGEFGAVIRSVIKKYPDVEVVAERFTITVETAKKSQGPYSLEVLGALKLIMQDNGMDWENLPLQEPANAKNVFPNAALQKLGYWAVGTEGHCIDAIRHALLYLVKTRWKPKGLLD